MNLFYKMELDKKITKCELYEAELTYFVDLYRKKRLICPVNIDECPYKRNIELDESFQKANICGTFGLIHIKEKGKITKQNIENIKERITSFPKMSKEEESKSLENLYKIAKTATYIGVKPEPEDQL